MSKISLNPALEEDLIKKCRRDKKYFAPLFEHYYPYIKSYFLRHVPAETADELTAKVFEKAFTGLDNYKWQGVSFSAWLYRIAGNTLIDYYRQYTREVNRKLPFQEAETVPDKTKDPEESYLEMDLKNDIDEILATLPAREKEIIYLKFYEGQTNKTIAAQLGLSETNVSTIVYRSIAKLRELMAFSGN
ncbi:MAG: sigma-70 family RNA polymerase sigma factor [Patescibacteria group bacterium]